MKTKYEIMICGMLTALLLCFSGCASVTVTTGPDNQADSEPRAEEAVADDENAEEADLVQEGSDPEEDNEPAKESGPEDGLTPEILSEIGGHYDDGQGDYVEINYTDHMVRFIKGGKQDHIYDEKICGYEEVEDGYLLKVEWEDYKYTYLYTVEYGDEHLYFGAEEGWEPELHPYAHIEGVQEYVKEGTGDEQELSFSEDGDYPMYDIGTIDLKKEGDSYYIYPAYPGEFTSENGESSYDVPGKVKVSEDAVIGIASDFYTTLVGEYDEGHFSYRYYNFYPKADKQLLSKRWFYNGDYMQFDVNGQEMPLTPLVSFNDNGEVDVFLEYYRP